MGTRAASTSLAAPLLLRGHSILRSLRIGVPLAVVVIALVAAGQVLMAREHLLAGSRDLAAARGALTSPLSLRDLAVRRRVKEQVGSAQQEFAEAQSELRPWSPFLAHLGWVPAAGPKLSAAPHVADAAYYAASAARALIEGMDFVWPVVSLSGAPTKDNLGPGRGASRESGHNASLLVRLTFALERGQHQFVLAERDAKRAEGALGQIAAQTGDGALDRNTARLRRDLPLLQRAGTWLALAPDLLGTRHPSHILFAWENPAELRATGGFVGATTFFTVRHGRLSTTFYGRAPPHEIASVPVPLPEAMYTFESHWILADSNWSPDFPLSARLERWFYGEDTGWWADAVIDFVDSATPDILRGIGPVYLLAYHRWVNAGNVNALAGQYVHGGGYWGPQRRGDPDTLRKQFLNATLRAALQRAQALPFTRWQALGTALARTIARGDLLLYDRQPAVEAAIRAVHADGGLVHAHGDFLSIVDDNRSYNKLNPYVQERAAYAVTILPALRLESTLTIHYHVDRSPAGLVGYGPGYGLWGTKHDYQDFLRVYVPGGAVLESTSGLERWAPLPAYGLTQLAGRFLLREGHDLTVRFRYTLPANVLSVLGGSQYRLTVQRQSGASLRSLQVTIRGSSGVSIAEKSGRSVSIVQRDLPLGVHSGLEATLHGAVHLHIVSTALAGGSDPYVPFAFLRDPRHPL